MTESFVDSGSAKSFGLFRFASTELFVLHCRELTQFFILIFGLHLVLKKGEDLSVELSSHDEIGCRGLCREKGKGEGEGGKSSF